METTNITPVQTSEPAAEGLSITREGITIRKRHGRRNEKYTCRIKFRTKVHWLTLSETADESFKIARAAKREIQAGRWAELKATTALRTVAQTTLGEIFTVYRQFKGPDRPTEDTLELNIHAITAIVRETLGDLDINKVSLCRLTSDFIWQWKEKKRKLADEADDDERSRQILRSANSRLRQARSIFSDNEDLRNFYRHQKITLPDCLAGFREEPGFSDCSKDEYHAPTDAVIAKTFAALEQLGQSKNPDDLNMFKACWLAIGFGHRASEIGQAKKSWYQKVDGSVFCRGDVVAKNKKFPEIRVQLDAWQRLAEHMDGDQDDYVLAGTKTERCDTVFRRISEWMRGLGWQTTHHVHELRAWAGCQIAMAPGGRQLLDAQVFMRHQHFNTTEKFYGHHLKIKLQEVKLSIPQVKPKEFVPVVLPTASQG